MYFSSYNPNNQNNSSKNTPTFNINLKKTNNLFSSKKSNNNIPVSSTSININNTNIYNNNSNINSQYQYYSAQNISTNNINNPNFSQPPSSSHLLTSKYKKLTSKL